MKHTSKMLELLVSRLKTSLETLNKDGAVIGVSGGVDSAVTLKLLEQCLPRNSILPMILPERDSNPQCIRLAEKLCHDYDYKKISITPILKTLGIYREFKNYGFLPRKLKESYRKKRLRQLGKNIYLRFLDGDLNTQLHKAIGYIRIKNRIRMAIMYYYAETRNYAVVGTINRTEYLLGFFVPFGDSVADSMPLFDLYKTDVFTTARELQVPDEIISRAPSPDLIPGVTDEMILGMSYDKIDEILRRIIENKDKGIRTEESQYIADICHRAKKLRAFIFPQRKDPESWDVFLRSESSNR